MKKIWTQLLSVTTVMLLSAGCTSAALNNPDSASSEKTVSSQSVPSSQTEEASDGSVQIPSPITAYDSIEDAQEAFGTAFPAPTALPDGYQQEGISLIQSSGKEGAKLVQIKYSNGNDTLTYRTAQEAAPSGEELEQAITQFSGDYNSYAEKETISIGENTVTTRGNDGTVSVAFWSNGGWNYCLTASAGISEDTVKTVLEGIQ